MKALGVVLFAVTVGLVYTLYVETLFWVLSVRSHLPFKLKGENSPEAAQAFRRFFSSWKGFLLLPIGMAMALVAGVTVKISVDGTSAAVGFMTAMRHESQFILSGALGGSIGYWYCLSRVSKKLGDRSV